jgi:hypothetical protein
MQSLHWRHDNDLDPYPNMPGRLRSNGISWLLELMQIGCLQRNEEARPLGGGVRASPN